MSDATLVAGAFVTPSIRLVRMLGRGGMGSVWVADHLGLHTQVVVKFVNVEHASSPEVRARFEREAALAAQAKSPHVVQVLDHGLTSLGVPYIAMELLEGEDLSKRIARDYVIAPALFADWLRQACKGLSRAHGKGIVHRDIKPENIFLCDQDGEVLVKVLDFGIAKGDAGPASFAGTKTGAFLGTAYYMSPEQMMGAKHLDHRCDLWAIGVVTYYALTGALPFDGDAIGAIAIAITSAPFVPPSHRNPALGPAIDAWMARALGRPLETRFTTAKELADAFATAVSGVDARGFSSSPPAASFGGTAVSAGPQAKFSTSTGVASERFSGTGIAKTAGSTRRTPVGVWLAVGAVVLGGAVFGTVLATRGKRDGNSVGATASEHREVATARSLPEKKSEPANSPAPPVVESPATPAASAAVVAPQASGPSVPPSPVPAALATGKKPAPSAKLATATSAAPSASASKKKDPLTMGMQ